MPYDPEHHHRRSIRLKGYDYAQPGGYFVTLCTQGWTCLFGKVVDGEMRRSPAGEMIHRIWHTLPDRFPAVRLDAFVVMPNHMHGIITLIDPTVAESKATDPNDVGAPLVGAPNQGAATDETDGAGTRPAPTKVPLASLGDVVGAFKSMTTRQYIHGVHHLGWIPFTKRLWQRNYWERIIRDADELDRIRRYIAENPARWHGDRLYVG